MWTEKIKKNNWAEGWGQKEELCRQNRFHHFEDQHSKILFKHQHGANFGLLVLAWNPGPSLSL